MAAKAEYWIAWHSANRSKALAQYIDIVKQEAARTALQPS